MTSNDRNSRPTIYPTLIYRDAHAAIRFLTEAFGFATAALHEHPDGTVAHAELAYGNGTVMVGSAGDEGEFGSAARDLGPSSVYVVVEDTDKHHERAVAHGAPIVMPVSDKEYGSRDYTARDLEGNLWTFGTYLPDPSARTTSG